MTILLPSFLSALFVLGLQAPEVPKWETSPQSAGMLFDAKGKATWGATLDIHRYTKGATPYLKDALRHLKANDIDHTEHEPGCWLVQDPDGNWLQLVDPGQHQG